MSRAPKGSAAWHVEELGIELRKTWRLIVDAFNTPLSTLHEIHVVEEDGSERVRFYLGPFRITRRLHGRLNR